MGTGGGRFTTLFQRRNTGGMRLDYKDNHIHIDPGPGALVLSNKYGHDPTELTSIILTHAHTDHYNDIEVLIEAMTEGGTKNRGELITSESGVKEIEEYGPAVSNYHKNLPKRIKVLNNSKKIELNNDLELISKNVKHSDPSSSGFVLQKKDIKMGFTSDTEFFKELKQSFSDLKLLVMNVTRPKGAGIPHHLSTDDAIKILKEIDPELTIITHLGMKMLDTGPEKQAEIIEEKTNKRCIAAEDGLVVNIDETIKVEGGQKKLTNFR